MGEADDHRVAIATDRDGIAAQVPVRAPGCDRPHGRAERVHVDHGHGSVRTGCLGERGLELLTPATEVQRKVGLPADGLGEGLNVHVRPRHPGFVHAEVGTRLRGWRGERVPWKRRGRAGRVRVTGRGAGGHRYPGDGQRSHYGQARCHRALLPGTITRATMTALTTPSAAMAANRVDGAWCIRHMARASQMT